MWRDDAYLLDMLLSARELKGLAAGVTREQFEASSLHQHACLHVLIVIGEAASQVSSQTKAAHPEIAWRQIVAFRNRLVHEYFDIELDKVWDAIANDVPALIRALEPLVPPPPPGDR